MNEKLTAQVKRKCNITWSDTETDARVEDIILSAIPVLIHKLGISLWKTYGQSVENLCKRWKSSTVFPQNTAVSAIFRTYPI